MRSQNLVATLSRRRAAAAIAAAVLPTTAAAQESWPRKPITLVVPFAPGGGTDTVARMIALRLQQAVGQPVVVDNRPGANGLVATRWVQQQPADGHTLLLGSNSTHVIAPLAAKQASDGWAATASRFSILGVLANAPLVLGVRRSRAPEDLAAFVARAKSGSLSYGTFGAGSSAHVAGEMLAQSIGAKFLHVPYKGSAPATTDLLGGQVDSVILTVAALEGLLAAGTVRALAVTGRKRVVALPDVPTFAELGVKGLEDAGWFAMFVAAGTPPDVAGKLSGALASIVKDAEVQAKLVELGLEPVGSTQQQAQQTWRQAARLAEPIVRRAGITF